MENKKEMCIRWTTFYGSMMVTYNVLSVIFRNDIIWMLNMNIILVGMYILGLLIVKVKYE